MFGYGQYILNACFKPFMEIETLYTGLFMYMLL